MAGNQIEITFEGGAPGTQLSELSIDTDKEGNGLSIGDCLFDTAPGGLGAYESHPLVITGSAGIDSIDSSVADGGTRLVFHFAGFDPGEKLVFTIDVDEMGFLGPNSLAEGNEFEGSMLSATFTAPHFYDASGKDMFIDFYDSKLAGSGLPLPPDNYMPSSEAPHADLTAGAIFSLEQEPLPIRISGTVFEDMNADNTQQPGDPGMASVRLDLLRLEGSEYVPTGRSATTAPDGSYWFDGLLPGTYRIAETQPDGYTSVGAKPGTVGGQTRGAVTDPDTLSDIQLLGGDESVRNDFAEYRPGSIGGRVIADYNDNCQYDAGDRLLPGVTLQLLDATGQVLATTQTDADGQYVFSGLRPGTYGVNELQPAGYLDGGDRVGSAGGALQPPDAIVGITLFSGTVGEHYDFCEVEPAALSGYVYADSNNNGVKDPGEPPLSGVQITLLDSAGNPIGTPAETDANGSYRFDGLRPGLYGVAEAQPAGYLDGFDTAGTAGGTAHNPGDAITGANLAPGTNGEDYNFGEILPASLAGMVFSDANDNGVYEPPDTPLAGVTVYLLDASGMPIAAATTDAEGNYRFSNLEPATYGVEEVQPGGYLDGKDMVGTAGGAVSANDRITGAKLHPGENATGYDFAEVLPAAISGYVFQDGPAITYPFGTTPPDPLALRDGKFRPDDARIAGVRLTLANARGEPILDAGGQPVVTFTDAAGYYQFAGLRPGTYTIIEMQPAGYIDGIDTAGSKGGIAVNANSKIDATILEDLAFDPGTDAILRIRVQGGDNGTGYNFSEIKVEELPLPPPPPPPPLPPPSSSSPPTYFAEPAQPAVWYQPGPVWEVLSPLNAGGAVVVQYTWHLSVVDAGRPREDRDGTTSVAEARSVLFNAVSWSGPDLDELEWILADSSGTPVRSYVFGLLGATPVVGDWNGDGSSKIGIFFDGLWFLDLDGNGMWGDEDLWARLGAANDRPVTGDWDGDGKTDIGIFGPAWEGDARAIEAEPGLPDVANRSDAQVLVRYKNIPPDPDQATVGWRTLKRTSLGKFRKDLIDHVFQYGSRDDVPVAGDWNGDGVTNIGVFRNGLWLLDADGDGRWSEGDRQVKLGSPGDVPVVGDWNGDGRTKLGVYRKGTWYLDTNGDGVLDARDKVFQLGSPGDIPVVGDWNGDGIDEVGVVRPREAKPDRSVARRDVPTVSPAPVSVAAPGGTGVLPSSTGVSPAPASTGRMPVPPADAPSAPAPQPAPSSGQQVAEGPTSAD
jgi:protocatechuate 3,4-dioxygenase beta subunit